MTPRPSSPQIQPPRAAQVQSALLLSVLFGMSLDAHGYERGAFAPKDPPLMPTVIVYSGENEPATTQAAPADSGIVRPAPAAPEVGNAAPTSSAPPPPPQMDSTELRSVAAAAAAAAAIPVTPHTVSVSTPAPQPQHSASVVAEAAPAPAVAQSETRYPFYRLLLLFAVIAAVVGLFVWLRRPYTAPHTRSKFDAEEPYDLDD